MAQITFTLTSPQLQRLVDAVTHKFGYSDTLDDGTPNPETPGQFTRRMIIEVLRGFVRKFEHEREAAALPPPPDLEVT